MAASCTGRMYAFRKTVKVDQNTIAVVEKKKQKEVVAIAAAPVVASEENTKPTDEVITAGPAEEVVALAPVAHSTEVNKQAAATTQQAHSATKAEKKNLVKTIKQKISNVTDSIPGIDSNVKKLLIAGLIFILAGIILYVINGTAGALATTIGAVLILIALILWLINIL
jgi:hypothetical protein